MKGVKMLQCRRDLLNEELRLIVFLDQGVKHSIKAGSFPDQSQWDLRARFLPFFYLIREVAKLAYEKRETWKNVI